MSKMAEQVNGTPLGDVRSNGVSAHVEDIQRFAYIRLVNIVSSDPTILTNYPVLCKVAASQFWLGRLAHLSKFRKTC